MISGKVRRLLETLFFTEKNILLSSFFPGKAAADPAKVCAHCPGLEFVLFPLSIITVPT